MRFKNGVYYGTELVKVDINVTPKLISLSEVTSTNDTLTTLSASQSYDEDGDELSFLWSQIAGSTVELIDAETSEVSFVSPAFNNNEVLTFLVVVSDGEKSAQQSIYVTVNQANRAPEVIIDEHLPDYSEGNPMTLSAIASDADNDSLTYLWSQLSGPSISFEQLNESTLSFTAPQVTTDSNIELQLIVSDGILSTTITTAFTVTNVPVVIMEDIKTPKSSGGSFYWSVVLLFIIYLKRNSIKMYDITRMNHHNLKTKDCDKC